MPATIQEVAIRAGVSTATVSRALRGLPNVSPNTRKQILQVADTLDYHVPPQVSRQASGRKVVGIIVPLTEQWYFGKLVSVIEIELTTQGYDAVRYSVDSVEGQISLLRYLINRRLVDGLIMCSLSLTDETADVLYESGLPVTTVETKHVRFSSVGIDNSQATQMATRYLINLGHRRIGLISGEEATALQFAIPLARKRGVIAALEQSGIEFRQELDQPGNYVYEGGAEAMKRLFSVHEPPTAVFAFSDEMAIGALKTIRDMNLRVPEDISVIGFDDNDVSAFVGLTTVRQPVTTYGEETVADLLHTFDQVDAEPVHRLHQAELVVRATTGPV